MFDLRLQIFKNNRLRRSCAPSTSSISHHQSHLSTPSTSAIINQTSHIPSHIQRSALTLIELLVVIVILTTLVGGVIPLLSPNNDVRKIQAASRGLQGYITQAKAQAARTGRPQGIAFQESSPESGVALEVFGWEVPPPFAGFSTESRVVITLPAGPPIYNAGDFPQLDGSPLYTLNLQLAGGVGGPDPLPPRSFRIGDVLDVAGNIFQIIDTSTNHMDNEIVGIAPNEIEFLGTATIPKSLLQCVWINNSGQALAPGLKRYQINRQPTTSSASPYQLPASIVIDMQGSVAEGSGSFVTTYPRFPTATSLYRDRTTFVGTKPADTVGIMFSPTGGVDSVYFNGNQLTSVSRIVLLLGRIENGGIFPPNPSDPPYDNSNRNTAPWTTTQTNNKEKVAEIRKEINWLNLDSRLLSIVANNGRAVVSETAFVDAPTYMNTSSGSNDLDTATEQIEAAHAFAHEMTTAK